MFGEAAAAAERRLTGTASFGACAAAFNCGNVERSLQNAARWVLKYRFWGESLSGSGHGAGVQPMCARRGGFLRSHVEIDWCGRGGLLMACEGVFRVHLCAYQVGVTHPVVL